MRWSAIGRSVIPSPPPHRRECHSTPNSSRNLYNKRQQQGNPAGNAAKYGEEGPAYGNLHDHHPIRYPKRSGLYGHIEEEGNETGDDEIEEQRRQQRQANSSNNNNKRVPARDILDRDADAPSDEDGLFRRASKAKNGGGTDKCMWGLFICWAIVIGATAVVVAMVAVLVASAVLAVGANDSAAVPCYRELEAPPRAITRQQQHLQRRITCPMHGRARRKSCSPNPAPSAKTSY